MYLDYYEMDVELTYEEKKVLLDLYIDLCKVHKMGRPEARRVSDLEDASVLTHVIYTVEAQGGERIPGWLKGIVNMAEEEKLTMDNEDMVSDTWPENKIHR